MQETPINQHNRQEKPLDNVYRSGRQYIYRRSIVVFIGFVCVALVLIIALANIQLINYEHYQSLTIAQYTQDTGIY